MAAPQRSPHPSAIVVLGWRTAVACETKRPVMALRKPVALEEAPHETQLFEDCVLQWSCGCNAGDGAAVGAGHDDLPPSEVQGPLREAHTRSRVASAASTASPKPLHRHLGGMPGLGASEAIVGCAGDSTRRVGCVSPRDRLGDHVRTCR